MRLLAKRVLDDLERYLRLDVRYFAQGIGVLWVTQAVLLVCGLFLTVVLSRLAGPEGYGQFQFVLALLGTVAIVTLPGLNTLVSVYVAQGRKGVARQAFVWKFVGGLIGALVLAGAALYVWRWRLEPEVAKMILIGAVAFPLVYSLDVVHAFFVGLRKIGRSCLVQVWAEGASALAAVVAFWLTRSLIWTVAVLLGAKVLALAFASPAFLREKGDRVAALGTAGFGFTLVNALPTVRQSVEKLMVAFFLGFAGTAMYAVALAIAEQLSAVGKQVGVLVLPKLAEGQKIGALRARLALLVAFFVGLGVLLAVVAPFLVGLLFGAEYDQARYLAPLYVLAVIPQAIGVVLAKALEVEQRMKGLYWVHGLYAALEMGGMFVALPLAGLWGVAVAKVVASSVFTLVVLREYRLSAQ